MRRYWPAAPVALLLSLGVGALGGALTDLGPWYQQLVQPSWKPPDWAFAPAWTTIFVCCAAAATIGWVNASDAASRQRLVIVFALNAMLNLLWSALFFTWKQPTWALVEILPLWLSVLAMTVVAWRISRLAGVLLLPYLAWVAFAATINYGVVTLNS